MSRVICRILIWLALFLLASGCVTSAFAQQTPLFTPGNLVVSVEGNGVEGGSGTFTDNQASPFTLFQFQLDSVNPTTVPAVYVNSVVLPQTGSGANGPVSGEYGSSSEGTLQLSGTGQYLTVMGYGVNAAAFNSNPGSFSVSSTNTALGQSGSQTGQSYTPVPRVATLIDPYGNVNSSTAIFNIFNTNNPRSMYTADGTNIYVSGQGASGDATGGVFYTTLGSSSATTITGADAGGTASQDTRDVQIYNNTLFISMDSKSGSFNRSYIGTLGTPPATSVFSCVGVGAGCPTGDGTIGPALMPGFGNAGGTGKQTITTGANSNGNNLNAGDQINLSPENYFFASPTVLYVADSGFPKNDSNKDNNSNKTANIGNGGLQKWIFSSGSWSLAYTLYQNLNLVNNGGTSGTTGLIGLTGVVVGNNVELFATNFTIGDLDPTFLYGITDNLSFTTASQAAGETFTAIATAPPDSNFKGVSLAPTLPAGSATITSSPSGLAFSSAGTGCAPGTYTTPVTLIWTPGVLCTLSVVSPQTATGTQYVFNQWQDGTTGTTDNVTAPTASAVFNAGFTTEYLLTTSATTGGTVSAGGYIVAGTDALITATPAAGYYFVNFTGATTSTNNPLSLLMNAPQTITANFAPQLTPTVTWPTASAITYGQTLAASMLAGGSASVPGTFAFTNPGTVPPVGMSPQSVTFTPTSNQYSTVTGTVSVTVNPAMTSISVTNVSPAAEDYGLDAPVTITAVLSWTGLGVAPTASDITIGGNGPSGTYGTTSCGASSGNTITCTSIYTPTAADVAGSYSESATFAGDSNYTVSSSAQGNNFTINLASSSTSVSSSINPSTYGQSVTLTATIGGENNLLQNKLLKIRPGKRGVKPPDVGGTVTWSDDTSCGTTPVTSGNPGVATCITSSLPGGTDVITATYSGDSNHTGSQGTLAGGQVVNQATQSITFTQAPPASAVYHSSFTVAATGGGSGNPVTFTSAGSCSNSSATFTMTSGTGTCSVIANQAGNGNYSAAPQVTESVNATLASQSITVTIPAPATATLGSSFAIVASASSGLPISFGSSGGCTNSGGTYTMASSGKKVCIETLNVAANSNYTAAAQVTESTSVAKAITPTVSFTGAPASATYATTFAVAASSNSTSVPVFTTTGPCTIDGTTLVVTMTSGTGKCSMTATWAGNDVYAKATATQKTTAAKVPSTVTWSNPAPITYGTPLSATQLNATASVPGTFVYSPASGRVLPVGLQSLSVRFTPTATADYTTVTDDVTLTVNPVDTTTSFTKSTPNPSTTGEAVTVSFSVAQAITNVTKPTGSVTVTASSGETCSGTLAAGKGSCKITFNTAGSITLTASYPGDANNNASVSAGFTQTVN